MMSALFSLAEEEGFPLRFAPGVNFSSLFYNKSGRGGIRTLEGFDALHAFQACAIGR